MTDAIRRLSLTFTVLTGLTCAAGGETPSQGVAQEQLDIRTPAGKILIAAEEIVAYDWQSHTLILKRAVRPWLVRAWHKGLLNDEPFIVAVDGQSIYEGRWMSSVMSMSRSSPVILLDSSELQDGSAEDRLRIDLGYPSEAFFKGADPRRDARIQRALKASDKLR
jgi:hypothetical protein